MTNQPRVIVSDKRPETDADILSRATSLRQGFSTAGWRQGRRYSLDLAGHMAECDKNYRRLLQLFPTIREEDSRCIALLPSNPKTSVELEVVERGPYTTLLQLTQRPTQKWGSSPNMRIRLYHDAKSAEVVAYQQQNRFHSTYKYPNRRMHQPDEKVQLNRFLSEYLSLCLAIGMTSDPVELPIG